MFQLTSSEYEEDVEQQSVLFYKIKWLMIFRIIVVTILLGSALIIQLNVQKTRPLDLLYGLIIASYVFTAVTVYLLKYITKPRRYAYLQILYDLCLETGIVYITGGVESLFTFTYIFTIIAASILLFRRGALIVASLSTIFYGVLVDLQFYQILPLYNAPQFAMISVTSSTIYYNIFLNSCAFYLVAFLSSYLSESLRRTHQRLRETSHDLTELQTFHQNILHSMHSGLLTTDLHGKITSFNPAAEQITGYKLSEVYGLGLNEVFPQIDTALLLTGLSNANVFSRAIQRFETQITPKTREKALSLGFSVSLLQDNHQKVSGLIFVFQDLTDLRAMQEHLARSDRLAALGQLAAGVAHEIRNPLASISGSIQMLHETDIGSNADNKALMEIILRESKRLDQILTDFLLYARPKPLNFAKCDLIHEVILSIIGLLKQDPRFPVEKVQVQVESAPNFPKVVCDVEQMQQVFWNVLTNAFQAMQHDGGTLDIQTRVEKLGIWQPQLQMPIYAAVISIRDTGVGIEEEQLRNIFNPFYTTKKGGSGLGLAIVHSILEKHRGMINVKSVVGQGTTCEVILPLTQDHW